MIQRREFITVLGGAAAWPLAAGAQQRAMLVIGYLSGRTEDSDASMLVSVSRGLADVGLRNIRIESRFADGRYDRLSAELTDLTQRKVGVIVSAVFLSGGILQQVSASPILETKQALLGRMTSHSMSLSTDILRWAVLPSGL